MNEIGKIEGYIFVPTLKHREYLMRLYRIIRYIDRSEPQREYMADFSVEESQALIRFRDSLIHTYPEPFDPRINWAEHIEGL